MFHGFLFLSAVRAPFFAHETHSVRVRDCECEEQRTALPRNFFRGAYRKFGWATVAPFFLLAGMTDVGVPLFPQYKPCVT